MAPAPTQTSSTARQACAAMALLAAPFVGSGYAAVLRGVTESRMAASSDGAGPNAFTDVLKSARITLPTTPSGPPCVAAGTANRSGRGATIIAPMGRRHAVQPVRPVRPVRRSSPP